MPIKIDFETCAFGNITVGLAAATILGRLGSVPGCQVAESVVVIKGIFVDSISALDSEVADEHFGVESDVGPWISSNIVSNLGISLFGGRSSLSTSFAVLRFAHAASRSLHVAVSGHWSSSHRDRRLPLLRVRNAHCSSLSFLG